MHILVVDEDRGFCRLIAELLASRGYQVDWASHALEAFKLAQRNYYELFIIDVRMPFISGTKLAAGLKEQFLGARIILVSAFADDALQERAAQLGVPLLGKPFTNEKFLALVGNMAKALPPAGKIAQGATGESDDLG